MLDSKEKIITTNIWSSELAKLASNAMLAQGFHPLAAFLLYVKKQEQILRTILCNRNGSRDWTLLNASVGFGGVVFKRIF